MGDRLTAQMTSMPGAVRTRILKLGKALEKHGDKFVLKGQNIQTKLLPQKNQPKSATYLFSRQTPFDNKVCNYGVICATS
jgi:hypothetical protein